MLITKIEIQGLSFIQADICGRCLPSNDLIKWAFFVFKRDSNRAIFCRLSNFYTIYYVYHLSTGLDSLEKNLHAETNKTFVLDDISAVDLSEFSILLFKCKCQLYGHSFNRWSQSNFIIQWLDSLMFEFRYDTQKFRKRSKAMLVATENITASDFYEEFLINAPMKSASSLDKPVEYLESKAYLSEIEWHLFQSSTSDPVSFCLFQLNLAYIHRVHVFKEADREDRFLCLCDKCRKYFVNKRINRSNICTSCKPKLKKEKKANRRINRKGWVSDRTGTCKGGCESPRIKINTSGICQGCYVGWIFDQLGVCSFCQGQNKRIDRSACCKKCYRRIH
jgi:hypothetical protein